MTCEWCLLGVCDHHVCHVTNVRYVCEGVMAEIDVSRKFSGLVFIAKSVNLNNVKHRQVIHIVPLMSVGEQETSAQ